MLPRGTQVVLERDCQAQRGDAQVLQRTGSVGTIHKQPTPPTSLYEVHFPDGACAEVARADLSVRRALAPAELLGPARPADAFGAYLILEVELGSRAYGLATEASDSDRKGVFVPPAEWTWSLNGVPEQVEFQRPPRPRSTGDTDPAGHPGEDHCWWELEKFLRLALRANPSVLEVLFVPPARILRLEPLGRELLDLRQCFLSRFLYTTYSGYVLSQFRRMRQRRTQGFAHKPKHAMHLVRLLLAGTHALRTGEILVDVTQHRDELLALKHPDVPFEHVHQRAMDLIDVFQEAFAQTSLPEQPDVATVDRFLIRARRAMVR